MRQEAGNGPSRDEEEPTDQEKDVDTFDFGSLGPPPPCPTLCRQKARDFTAERERKGAEGVGQRPVPRVLRRLPDVRLSIV
ncbi:hypothetical protein PHMEG_00011429 [Phytophthora megakarya]|uniref:Uncharacterized protein n=1 Tax=Phytophthora megakarya TaxID=4795 RepID=A0A225WBB1_9STRA|nr:hypothetical protein PHMEG_00011429 [Phytophthora megakarya]